MLEIRPGSWVGPYKVIALLKEGLRGGKASLFIAQLARDGIQLVALKVVPVEEGELFELNALRKEVEILQKLRHPNLVKIYPIPSRNGKREHYIARATNVPGNPYFCAMEHLGGGSLRDRLQELGTLPLGEAVEIAYQIGSTLDYMHSKGYVHWDVKPENILFRYELSENGMVEAVLTDFGIARGTHEPAVVAGTVDYMSPERLRVHMGEIPPEQIADQRPADVYALGLVLYEMLAGNLPFVAEDKEGLKSAVLEEQPIPLTDFNYEVPPAVEDVIFQTLEKNPANRPTIEETVTMMDRAVPAPRLRVQPPSISAAARVPAAERVEIAVPRRRREREEAVERPPAKPSLLRRLQTWALMALAAMLVFGGIVWGARQLGIIQPPPTSTPVVMIPATPTPNATATVQAMFQAVQKTATAQAVATEAAIAIATARAPTATPLSPTPTPVPPTSTPMPPTPIPTPRRVTIPTPTRPKASPPTLISPERGGTYGNPVIFQWEGTPGQTYQVRARSSRTGFEVKSPSLSATSWTTNLPPDHFGEWRWKVSVLWDGSELATSDEGMFWFQPYITHEAPPTPSHR